jgi:hypothetical protein
MMRVSGHPSAVEPAQNLEAVLIFGWSFFT